MAKDKYLFCNITWMDHYDKELFPLDKPRHGGAYVRDTGEA